jgi:nucleoside-diphosphate-sugar epimerase
MRIFLAGATGVIGRRLIVLLRRAGHEVTGSTRSADKAPQLEASGVRPAIVDVFDAGALERAVAAAEPEGIIHQLTDLPHEPDRALIAAAAARNARLRIEGTRNLIDAALHADVRRVVAQSIAFVYAPGPEPHGEADPLDETGPQETTVRGVLKLEQLVTRTAGIEGIVLRYGYFYGPGTWNARPPGRTSVHVDAAAKAAELAVTHGVTGIYNVAEGRRIGPDRQGASGVGLESGIPAASVIYAAPSADGTRSDAAQHCSCGDVSRGQHSDNINATCASAAQTPRFRHTTKRHEIYCGFGEVFCRTRTDADRQRRAGCNAGASRDPNGGHELWIPRRTSRRDCPAGT